LRTVQYINSGLDFKISIGFNVVLDVRAWYITLLVLFYFRVF